MKDSFDTLINSFVDSNIGIANDFLSESLAVNLKENLLALLAKNLMVSAGTGNDDSISFDKTVRNDKIYWLDRKHENVHENEFLNLIDEFVIYLNKTCYTGITGYEFHYAVYEKGSFYKKHLDQFRNNSSRKYSMVLYLNPDWETADGGELRVYSAGSHRDISPINRKGVFFDSSEIPHEVMLSHEPRYSITGWLKVN